MQPVRIKLPYDGLIGLLQGKEIHLMRQGGEEVIIASPFDGVFMTHQQIDELRRESEMNVLKLLDKLYTSREENFNVE